MPEVLPCSCRKEDELNFTSVRSNLQALRNGAAPYLSAKDRVAIGMARSSSGNLPASHTQPQAAHGAGLKFQAYEKAALPVPRPLAGTDPFAGEDVLSMQLGRFTKMPNLRSEHKALIGRCGN